MRLKKCLVVLVVFENADSLSDLVAKIPQDYKLIIVHNDLPYRADFDVTTMGNRKVLNIYNGNRGMLAGAYNRVVFDEKITDGYSHLMLLDQDSDTSRMESFIGEYFDNSDLQHHKTVCAPLYVDRGTMRKVRIVRFRRFGFQIVRLDHNSPRYIPASCIINSMAIIPIEVAKSIGGWDEVIGLDHIDTDFCLKALAHENFLIYDTKFSFLHSIGERKMAKIFGIAIQSTFHSDFRVGLIFENSGVLFKRYFLSRYVLNFIPLLIVRMFYDLLGIIVVEKNSSKFLLSCKMFWKGIFR